MVTLTISELIGILGVPSVLSGIFMLIIQRGANKREKKRDMEEKARCDHEYIMMKELGAATTLDVVTAKIVQKIPDAHCNGDMQRALDDVIDAKCKHQEFMNMQGIAYMRHNN